MLLVLMKPQDARKRKENSQENKEILEICEGQNRTPKRGLPKFYHICREFVENVVPFYDAVVTNSVHTKKTCDMSHVSEIVMRCRRNVGKCHHI